MILKLKLGAYKNCTKIVHCKWQSSLYQSNSPIDDKYTFWKKI